MKKQIVLSLGAMAVLAGCAGSNDYTPAAGAPGGKIYADACSGCHKAISEFAIPADKANAAAIAEKVGKGSMMMPSFPNIKGEGLDALTQYVVENSKRK